MHLTSPKHQRAVSGFLSATIVALSAGLAPLETFGLTADLTTAGNGSWTVPAGVRYVTVEAWGGGASGGGSIDGVAQGAGGGGGGEFRISRNIPVTPGQAIPFTIGAGRSGTSGNGRDGADTIWGNGVVVSKGGKAGTIGSPGLGGTGGSGGIGEIGYPGGRGADGRAEAGGGGGEAASPATKGNDAIGTAGGTGTYGGDGGLGGSGLGANGGAAYSGANYGGGGGGSGKKATASGKKTTSTLVGGSGTQGKIVLTYFTNAAPAVALDTAEGVVFATAQPTLEFTGTDIEKNDARYQVQISDASVGYAALGQTGRDWNRVTINSSNQDVYATVRNGDIYKQTGGTGDFQPLGQVSREWRGIAVNSSNNDVYAVVDGGDIYKQAGGQGAFMPLGETARHWTAIAIDSTTHNTYAAAANGDIYKQTGGQGAFVGLGQGSKMWTGVAVNPITKDVYASVSPGDIYRQAGGQGMFMPLGQTTRQWYHVNIDSATNDVYVLSWNEATLYKQFRGTGNFYAVEYVRSGAIAVDGATGNIYNAHQNGDVYKQLGITLEAVAGTDDGFLNTVNAADTNPFTSGEKASFTPPQPLPDGTYVYRVKAIDPAGSNRAGDWSAPQTFTILTQ